MSGHSGDSIEELLSFAEEQLREIESIYQKTLAKKEPGNHMHARIKNLLENERSAFDHLAVRITRTYGKKKHSNIYYPLAVAKKVFDAEIDRTMPGVRSAKPEVAVAIGRYQPFNRPWLKRLNRLTRENKHNDLSPQTKTQAARREVRKGDRTVTWDPSGVKFTEGGMVISGGGMVISGGNVTIGPGGTDIMGEPVDRTTQRTRSSKDVIYIDWLFTDLGISVLSTLREFVMESRGAIQDIRQVAGL